MDIHNYKRRIESTLNRIANSDISDENKKLIKKFYYNLVIEGLSSGKIERYLYDIFKFSQLVGVPLEKAEKEEIKAVVAQIEQNSWSPYTKHLFKISIRKFYRSIAGIEEKGVYPEKVKWLHSNVKRCNEKTPEDLVTSEEIKKMINYCPNMRDRAFIASLYESGCRISELGLLKLKDITFDQYGAVINVTGKTGVRRVRLVNSSPYLVSWLNHHELNEDPESYVWISHQTKKLLSYTRLIDIIKESAKGVGIKKRIHPHLFRHSRATLLANKLTEAQMKQYLGWTQSSKMAAVYVHLSGRDTDDAILNLNGIKILEEKKVDQELRSKTCPRCNKVQSATTRFCEQCGMILNEEESTKLIQTELQKTDMEELLAKLLQNKDNLKLLLNQLGDIQNIK